MMTRRTRLMIMGLIVLAFLLLLAWLLWALFFRTSKVEEVLETVEVMEEEEVIPSRPTISEQERKQEQESRSVSSDVVALSKSFVTRYGSYSNEANFANLHDVLPLVSVSFALRIQKIIDTGEAPLEYYGVTTNIVTVKVDEKGQTTSRVTVMTQREEAIGSLRNVAVKYQDIVLAFVMEDGLWKVDSATWQ